MPVWDEKIPGGPNAMPAGLPGAMPTDMTALIQQMVASNAMPSLAPKQSEIVPGSPGGLLPAPVAPNVGGMQPLPSGMPVAPNPQQAQFAGPFPQAGKGPQPDMAQTFSSKGQRDTFLVQTAIQGVGEGVRAYKQKKFEEESNQVSQAWQNYLYFKQGADKGDPKAKQMMDQMMADPKIHKLFDKAQKDLQDGKQSGASVGLQKAIQNSQQQASQQLQLEELMAKIQNQKAQMAEAQAKAEQARALTPKTPHQIAIAMGEEPSADITARMKELAAQKEADREFKQKSLDQAYDLAQERMRDARTATAEKLAMQKTLADIRTEQVQMRIDAQAEKAAEKSKIPSIVINRVIQADTIKQQIADLKVMMDDPEVQKYMGPMVGMGIGLTRRWNEKASNAKAAWDSLIALYPVLHGYRGGQQIHATFQSASGGMAQTPASAKASLEAFDKLSDNFIEDTQKFFPKDPLWSGPFLSEQAQQKLRKLQEQQQKLPTGPGPDGKPLQRPINETTGEPQLPDDVKAIVEKLNQGQSK